LQSNPIWPVKTRFPKLNDDINVDVGIIGGGIAGISSAYHLKNAGYRVAILEQDEIGSAATGASSGILYYGSGTNFVEAMALFGKEKAKFLWSETEKMINDITKLVEDNDIDCGLRKCGAIMVAKNDQEVRDLEAENSALKECGFETKILSGEEIGGVFRSRSFLSGLEFKICTQLHPARFASGLANAAGITIYENSGSIGWENNDDSIIVKTQNGKMTCSKLLIATNIKPLFGLEKHFYTESSAIIASEKVSNINDIWPEDKIIWSMEREYDIIYPGDGRCILELYRLNNKKSKLEYYYPNIKFTVDKEWGNVWSKTKDYLPIFGPVKRNINVSICMGDQGIVMGSLTGKNIVDSIEGKRNMFLDMVSPSRFPLQGEI
jgi:glycine/D-amino acid oxidase-like deaminating enzyme